MEAVILPHQLKEAVTNQVTAYRKLRQYQRMHHMELDRRAARGLVVMFHGPSGTGKTLTVNAVAKHLGMR